MSEKRRARSGEEKATKRKKIIDSARTLFAEKDIISITVDQIAAVANIAKGTFFLYFSTREELFLSLAEELFSEFFNDLYSRITGHDGGRTEDLHRILNDSLFPREELLRMMPLLGVLIEKNVSYEKLKDFKWFLLSGLEKIGTAAERRFHFLKKAGGGVHFFYWLYGVVIGFQNLSTPVKNSQRIIDEQQMEAFHFNFEDEFDTFIRLILKGLSK